jgi:superfamily II RNA helicase
MHQGEDLNTDLVVLDEAHFLGDTERGVVWEEIMIYLPTRIPLLLLSATIGNAPQIAAWLNRIRMRECRVVAEYRRPVPLYPIFFHPSGTLMPLMAARQAEKPRLYKKVLETIQSRRPQQLAPPGKLPFFGDMLRVLKRYDLLPAIFFLKSRADCDGALELCLANRPEDSERDQQRRARIDALLSRSPHIAHHRQRWHLENLAVGSHHAGQLPAWKLVLEDLMTRGLLDAVFATSTVAAGVNFPARSVVLFNSDRFNGIDFVPLTPTEFHQMTGRAGRRGMDNIGFCILAPGKFMDLRLIARLLQASPSDVNSQIKINFSMVLNLLLSHRPAQVEDLLERSFATYQQARNKDKRPRRSRTGSDARHLWEDFLHHLEFLQRYDYVAEDGTLTDDGFWASRLRVDQPLLIAEGFRRSAFPEDNPALMAAIVASFVHERETDDRIDRDYLPKPLMGAFLKLRGALAPFAKDMLNEGFHARPLYLKPAAAVYAWVNGGSWDTALTVSEMEEGILATLLLRTADNLRHIRALSEIFPTAARTAGEAIDRIMRDPVSLFY